MSSYALTFEHAFRGIYASWRLFIQDSRAVDLLENNYRGAIRSYWAALVILPVYAMTVVMEYLTPAKGYANFGRLAQDTSLLNATVTEVIVYMLCWFVVWPLVMDRLTPLLRCDGNFFRYVCAYNWMHMMYAVIGVVFWTFVLAGGVDTSSADDSYAAALCLVVVLCTYHWSVLRHALGVHAVVAAVLAIAEFLLTTMIVDFIVNTAAG